MNNTIDEIDELFFNYFNSNKKVPDIIENGIKSVSFNFIEQENKVISLIKKFIITIMGIATITGGVVFAKDISNFLRNFFGVIPSDGVDTAVNNGYVAVLDTEYQDADGIEVRIDSMLMDDVNLCLNFIVILNDKYNIEKFKTNEISFDDLKIVDETGKTVFITHPYDTEQDYLGSYGFTKYLIDERTFRVSFIATDYTNFFPRSKELFVDFNILNSNTFILDKGIVDNLYKGNWHFKVDVPKEFYNRETILYKVKSSNIEQLNGVEAYLTNTTFRIYIPEIVTEKIEYFSQLNKESLLDWKPFNDVYIETSNKARFGGYYGIENSSGYGTPFNEERIIGYYQTFNLTSYDATDVLKLHMITNKNQEIMIELEKIM